MPWQLHNSLKNWRKIVSNGLTQAQELHQAGKLDEALRAYQALLEEDPKQADVLHALAILLAQTGHSNQALTLVRQALELEPLHPAFLNTLGNLYLRTNTIDKAISTLKQAITAAPKAPAAYVNLGNAYRKTGNTEKAMHEYQKALVHNKKHIDAHYNLALCLIEKALWDLAIQELKAALLYSPKHPGAHGQIAQVYLQTGAADKAVIHFKKRLELQPGHADSYHDLGLAYLEKKSYQKALDALLEALELNPSLCDAHYHIATAYIQLGEYTDALKYYLRQLEKKPYEECYFNIAVLLMYEGRAKEALDYFNHTLDLNPNHFDTHINLGVMYLKANNKPQAITHYQKALNIRPEDKEALHILSAIEQKNAANTAPKEYIEHLFDQYAPYYDIHLQEQLKYRAPQLIKDALANHTTITDCQYDILDLGCGTGLTGQIIKPYAKSIAGVDVSENMINIARAKKIYDPLLTATILEAFQTLDTFDVIVAADVFSYIGDLRETLLACKDHLNLNGYLIFTVEQNFQTDDFVLQETIRYGHNPSYLDDLMKDIGYESVDRQNIILREQNKEPVEGLLLLWRCISL
jgi:predicted TPR repeat methyltransferase